MACACISVNVPHFLIVAQPTRELEPAFPSVLPLPKLEKMTAPNFRLDKDGLTDELLPSGKPFVNKIETQGFI